MPISAIESQDERKAKNNLSRKRRETKAVMGRPDGVVKATGSSVYVTLGNGKIETIFNNRVSLRSYKKIVVGFTEEAPNLWQVLRDDVVYNDIPKPSISPHKDTHLWYGEDPIEVHPQNFIYLAPRAKAGFEITVYFGFYTIGGIRHVFPTQDIDLSGEVVAAGAEWVNVEVDDSLNITFQHGANVANKSLLIPEDIPDTASDKYLLCSVRMYYGQLRVNQAPTNNDIFDPRFAFGGSGSGGGSTPGGSDGDVQFNDAGALGGDATFHRESDGAIIIGPLGFDGLAGTKDNNLFMSADGNSVGALLKTLGSGFASFLTFIFGNGTDGSITEILADQVMGRLRWRAYDSSTTIGLTSAEIHVEATEDHDSSSHGTRMVFSTTPNGSTTPVVALTIDDDQILYDKDGNQLGGGVTDGDKGDVVVSSGGTVWTIDDSAVSLEKMADASAQYNLIGRSSSGAGVWEEIASSANVFSILGAATYAAIRRLLNIPDGDGWTPDANTWTFKNRTQAYTNDPAAGTGIVLNMTNTADFVVGSYVNVSSGAGSDTTFITAVVANTSITVNQLLVDHNTTSRLVTLLDVFTINADVTANIKKGTMLKFTQTTVKYGVVYSSAYSGGNTTIVMLHNTDFALANAAISSTYYSNTLFPSGWPFLFNYDPAPQGWSVLPSTNIVYQYMPFGKFMNIFINQPAGTSTSSATTTKFATPALIVTASACVMSQAMDNGVLLTGAAKARTGQTGIDQVIDCYSNMSTGAWTGSGTKRLVFVLTNVEF